MELIILLNDAITSIQNLKDYYMNQIDLVIKQVNAEAERYKYGVLLEKFFFSKMIQTSDIEISESEQEILESILETYDIQETDEMGIIRYKINKN